ncbi:MAG: carboxypeptidase regulatory-like domain-containing protein [Terriglobales bacterium]
MSCFVRRMPMALFAILILFFTALASAQNTIRVPTDQSTIQGAINVANTGDTVLVASGTYSENISFLGKAINVTSASGASVTIIDGGGKAAVVTFNGGEGSSSVLNGFTIQNGTATLSPPYDGGGIYISSASPTITNNVIQNNTACSDGGGIAVLAGSPRIQGNTIQNNTQSGCSGGSGGGGISLLGAGVAQIVGNVIANNTWPSGNGGGISMNAAGTPTIKNNVITGNTATGVSPAAQGGGISMVNDSDPVIVQNLIYNNTAGQGSGVYFLVPSGSRGPILVSNTIIGGSGGSQGVAVYANGYDNQAQFFNNLLIGPSGQNAVYCDGTYQQQSPTFANNDASSPGGTGLAGTCSGQSSQNGNISADPQFVNASAGNFHLQLTSPAVDAGTNSAPDLPQTDYAGNPRILDGNNDCVSTVDIGAYELVLSANVSFSTNTLTFASQPIGTSSNPQSVGLSNTGSTCFQFSSIGITGDFSQTNACSAAGVRAGSSCAFNVTFTPTVTGPRSGGLAVSGSDGITAGNLTVNLSGIGAAATYSISGTISGPGGNGATVTLSGTASATVTASSTGTYSFSNLTNGSYVVTPSNSGFTFTPPNQGLTVSGANFAGVNFSSAAGVVGLALDKSVSTDRSTSSSTIVSPAFTTTAGNELLLAFIATDGKTGAAMTVTSVTGAGLTWSLVKRANAQAGTAEIWRAFAAAPLGNVTITANLAQSVAASITVVTFTGVDTSGTNGSGAIGSTAAASAGSGAPSASLTTTRNDSWVFGVGDDWDNATARTPGSNQTLVHQYLATIGDTYWVQQQNSPTALSGTTVTINDTAPTSDRYNLAIVEVLPTATTGTYSISGTINGPGGNGATVTLTGTSGATVTADTSGNYSFTGLANGPYTITPTQAGFTFSPGSQNVTLSGLSQTGVNFGSAAQTYSVSGTISGPGGNAATVNLTGTSTATVSADPSGNYTFTGLTNGSYTVTPSKTGFTFTPASQPAAVNNANVTALNFSTVTYSISGTISGTGGNAATVNLTGTSSATVTTDASGNYTFSNLANGSYTVTPSKSGFSFTPVNTPVTVSGANVTAVNFSSAAATTFTISGTISGSGGNGATVTLSGASSATATASATGTYTFSNLADGSYTVTPSKTGFIFTPASTAVTVNGANMTANFTSTAKLAIDMTVSTDRSTAATTIASPTFTTTQTNELLLAFVSTDASSSGTNTTVSSIAGGSLTWALVLRTNTQRGTAEIWRAYSPTVLTSASVTATLSQSVAASITVVTISGVDTTGTSGSGAIGATASANAASGAPTASLTTTRNNSWVFGVGDDWDNSISRTLGTNQTMVHQYLATVGDTYWVQRQTATTPASGTAVTINDTAPTGDRYNLTVVEVLPSL